MVGDFCLDSKLLVLATMVLDGHVEGCAIESRLDESILHLHLIGDGEFHRLPDSSRVITIETMSDVLEHLVGDRHGNSHIHHLVCLMDIFDKVTGYLHGNQVLARLEQLGAIRCYLTKHTDVRSSQLSVDINLSHLADCIKSQGEILASHVLWEFYPLTIPRRLGATEVEGVVLTAVGFLLIISI